MSISSSASFLSPENHAAAQLNDLFHTNSSLAAVPQYEIGRCVRKQKPLRTKLRRCKINQGNSANKAYWHIVQTEPQPKTDMEQNWAIWALQSGSQSHPACLPVCHWAHMKKNYCGKHVLIIKFSSDPIILSPGQTQAALTSTQKKPIICAIFSSTALCCTGR